jgi:8-oxo-dGTP diphosphatase
MSEEPHSKQSNQTNPQTTSYETARVAVDMVALTYRNSELCICLHQRERDPFVGLLELPGGLILSGEAAEETVVRKIAPFVEDIHKESLHQFFTFTDPKRDPRVRTITIGYLASIRPDAITRLYNWHPISSLAPLAFDHRLIVETALKHLANLDLSYLRWLMPPSFRLNDLHRLAVLIYGSHSKKVSSDNRNFRRDILKAGLVISTGEFEAGAQHRPAQLYQFV